MAAEEEVALDLEELRHIQSIAKRPRILDLISSEISSLEKVKSFLFLPCVSLKKKRTFWQNSFTNSHPSCEMDLVLFQFSMKWDVFNWLCEKESALSSCYGVNFNY